ncbi:hypothetical protein OC835_007820 [Tilletia horrida]|nr:hypothetical protein OC835_007820 [Tilletia horrida]
MLATSLLALIISVFAMSSTGQAAPLDARASSKPIPQIHCAYPETLGPLISTGPSGIARHATFQGATDSQGQPELSTSLNGVPAPDYAQFEFTPCTSTVMPSGRITNSDGSYKYFGKLRPAGHPEKCATVRTQGIAGTTTEIISIDCDERDLVEYQLEQWFTLTRIPQQRGQTYYGVGYDGVVANATAQVYYGWTNEYDSKTGAHLVKLQIEGKPFRTPFSVQIVRPMN